MLFGYEVKSFHGKNTVDLIGSKRSFLGSSLKFYDGWIWWQAGQQHIWGLFSVRPTCGGRWQNGLRLAESFQSAFQAVGLRVEQPFIRNDWYLHHLWFSKAFQRFMVMFIGSPCYMACFQVRCLGLQQVRKICCHVLLARGHTNVWWSWPTIEISDAGSFENWNQRRGPVPAVMELVDDICWTSAMEKQYRVWGNV